MLAEATGVGSASIVSALQRASAVTGSDFHYLLSTAMRESNLQPQARSSTSSASGLFQFVEQTWYGLVKEYGAKHGLGSYANAISQDADGRFAAGNAADRQAILALRNDPQISALMAGEYACATEAALQNSLGRKVCSGELYAAHFLGLDDARRLIRLSGSAPDVSAADAFPKAANANRSVFYRPDGTSRTVREVYEWALKQPSSSVSQFPTSAGAIAISQAGSLNYAGLLATLWTQSATGFFPTGSGEAISPFLLSPSVLDILSSFAPVANDDGAS